MSNIDDEFLRAALGAKHGVNPDRIRLRGEPGGPPTEKNRPIGFWIFMLLVVLAIIAVIVLSIATR